MLTVITNGLNIKVYTTSVQCPLLVAKATTTNQR